MSDLYFLKGNWNVICDRCGEKFKSSQVKKEWTGLMVCDTCYEPRHPQDFIRTVPDRMDVPFVRPRPADIFIPSTREVVLVDNVGLEETFAHDGIFTRYIPNTDVRQILPPIQRPLNTFALNGKVLGAADSSIPNRSESLGFTESLFVNMTKAITETMTLQETLMYFVGSLLEDEVNVTESMNAYIVADARVLNGSALNRGALG